MPTPTTIDRNRLLAPAKAAKKDEFYTQWADIEREMNAYLEYDPDVFRGKWSYPRATIPNGQTSRSSSPSTLRSSVQEKLSPRPTPQTATGAASTTSRLVRVQPAPRYDARKNRCRGKMFVLEGQGHQRRRGRQHPGPPVGLPRRRWRLPQPEVTVLRDKRTSSSPTPRSAVPPLHDLAVRGGNARFP